LGIALLLVSCLLIVHNSDLHRSKYAVVEGEIAGFVHSTSSWITAYINLKTANKKLVERTLSLESRIQYLENQIFSMKDTATARSILDRVDFDSAPLYTYKMAKIVNSSRARKNNYVTLNKGTNSGIVQDMGVFSATGVVGIVMSVSENYSVVLPVLNTNFHLSCKIKGTNYFGTLSWDGKDVESASLEELPSYAQIQNGDTIVTSGYSSSFPEGVLVGIVEELKHQKKDNSNKLRIKLLTDFGAFHEVLLVDKKGRLEQKALEETTKANLEKGSRIK